MGNIRMELEKLITYTMGQDIVTREDIEEICTTRTENKIFDMVRAVTERNQRRALDLYNDLLTLREPPMRILFLLSKQFRQMCLAKKMAGEGHLRTKLQPDLAYRLLWQEIYWPVRELTVLRSLNRQKRILLMRRRQ